MAQTNGLEQRLAELERRLSERIKALEGQICDLRMEIGSVQDGKDWWRTIGRFVGNEGMKQIDEAGRRIREADREKARKAAARRPAGGRTAGRQSGPAEAGMILLDTDHFSVLKYPENPATVRLTARMAGSPDDEFFITVVTAEEQIRGWLAKIARAKSVAAQVMHYHDFAALLGVISRRRLALFTDPAADIFEDLRRRKVRIGSMDLKIAAIALANDALLLSANLRDYTQVPRLRVEDWLKP